MPAAGSSPSSASRRSRSSPSTPARSSQPTASSPTRATGATRDETPASGRVPADRLTLVSPMTRLMCHRCRDSRQWRARRDSGAWEQQPVDRDHLAGDTMPGFRDAGHDRDLDGGPASRTTSRSRSSPSTPLRRLPDSSREACSGGSPVARLGGWPVLRRSGGGSSTTCWRLARIPPRRRSSAARGVS